VHRDGRSYNEVEGGERASNSGEREAEVQAKGREMVMERGVEHLIHNLDGTIGERNTYPAAATLSGIPGRRPSRRR
jgi:hypothetical protein